MHTVPIFQRIAHPALNPYVFKRIVVGETPVGLPDEFRQATEVMISTEAGTTRYRVDGGLPTPTEAHQLLTGSTIFLYGPSIMKFRICREGTVDGVIQVTGFRNV